MSLLASASRVGDWIISVSISSEGWWYFHSSTSCVKSIDLVDSPGQRTFRECFHLPVDLPDQLIRWPVSHDCLFFMRNQTLSSLCSMLGSKLDGFFWVCWTGLKAEKVWGHSGVEVLDDDWDNTSSGGASLILLLVTGP